MRVLVTGARGMLGRQVAREYQKRGVTVYPLARQELDITNCEQVFSILDKIGPNIVVNCAAYTDVDGAEQEKEKAFLMNGLGPRYLALACRRCGAAGRGGRPQVGCTARPPAPRARAAGHPQGIGPVR